MPKFRKQPVVVEAMQYQPLDFWKLVAWMGAAPAIKSSETGELQIIYIQTLEGKMEAQPGDWIVRGIRGEFYPVKDPIFRETYEPVEESHE